MPKIEGGRSLTPLGPSTVFVARSSSRPNQKHYVIVHESGSINCSCEGFCNHGHCWHIDAIPTCNEVGIEPDVDKNFDLLHGRESRTRECVKVQLHLGGHVFNGPAVEHVHDFSDGSGKCSLCGEDPFEGLG